MHEKPYKWQQAIFKQDNWQEENTAVQQTALSHTLQNIRFSVKWNWSIQSGWWYMYAPLFYTESSTNSSNLDISFRELFFDAALPLRCVRSPLTGWLSLGCFACCNAFELVSFITINMSAVPLMLSHTPWRYAFNTLWWNEKKDEVREKNKMYGTRYLCVCMDPI